MGWRPTADFGGGAGDPIDCPTAPPYNISTNLSSEIKMTASIHRVHHVILLRALTKSRIGSEWLASAEEGVSPKVASLAGHRSLASRATRSIEKPKAAGSCLARRSF